MMEKANYPEALSCIDKAINVATIARHFLLYPVSHEGQRSSLNKPSTRSMVISAQRLERLGH